MDKTQTAPVTKKRKFKVHMQFDPWETREIPESSYRLAMGRTEHLEGLSFQSNYKHLVACAYLQGVEDAVEAFNRKGLVMPDAPP